MNRSRGDWLGNIAALAVVVVVNGLSGAVPLNGQTMPEISAKYPSLFTPAGFTFSIWGVIYLGLLCFVVYQALPAQRSNADIAGIGPYFKLNCLANSLWIFAWHYDYLWLSLALMIAILISLVAIYRRLSIVDTTQPRSQQWLVQFPFGLYTAWITVALIANLSAVQIFHGWDKLWLSPVSWTLLKLAIAGAIGATVLARRGDMVFMAVASWAAYGISVKQAASPAVAGAAWMLALLGLALIVFELIRRQRRL